MSVALEPGSTSPEFITDFFETAFPEEPIEGGGIFAAAEDTNILIFPETGDVGTGGVGTDVLQGNEGDDNLQGAAGDDFVFGSEGDDIVRGDAGDDVVVGGAGSDIAIGGSGTDIFEFFAPQFEDGDLDLIRDFEVENDSVVIVGTTDVTFDDASGIVSVDGVEAISIEPGLDLDVLIRDNSAVVVSADALNFDEAILSGLSEEVLDSPELVDSPDETATVTSGVTSVFLDLPLLESAAGLELTAADGTAEPFSDEFQVGFAIAEETDFTFSLPFAPVSGSIEHSGSITLGLDDTEVTVGDFSVGFDASRVSETASGFFLADTLDDELGLEILFDIGEPGLLSATEEELTVAEADLLVAPEFADALGLSELTGADVGDTRIDAEVASAVIPEADLVDEVTETISSSPSLEPGSTSPEFITDFFGTAFPEEPIEGGGIFAAAEDTNILIFPETGDVGTGGSGTDVLQGNEGDDNLQGAAGDDFLFGSEGDDIVRGDAGDDVIVGGAGSDIAIGGSGTDIFEFFDFQFEAGDIDLIRDFEVGLDSVVVVGTTDVTFDDATGIASVDGVEAISIAPALGLDVLIRDNSAVIF